MEELITKDIALFYYYSSPPMPECCYLQMRPDIAYRNMLFLPCEKKRIHFELPMFEDHTYNTICNPNGVMSLIKRPESHEKYVIFRTRNRITGEGNVIGYYRLGQAYYCESKMFDNDGFIWGFKASESFLLRSGDLKFPIARPGRNYRKTWDTKSDRWPKYLPQALKQIRRKRNFSDLYQQETNRLVALLKDEKKVEEWRRYCNSCEAKLQCMVYRHYQRIGTFGSGRDMYTAINEIYTGTIYSRNALSKMKKTLIRGGE